MDPMDIVEHTVGYMFIINLLDILSQMYHKYTSCSVIREWGCTLAIEPDGTTRVGEIVRGKRGSVLINGLRYHNSGIHLHPEHRDPNRRISPPSGTDMKNNRGDWEFVLDVGWTERSPLLWVHRRRFTIAENWPVDELDNHFSLMLHLLDPGQYIVYFNRLMQQLGLYAELRCFILDYDRIKFIGMREIIPNI